MSASLGGAIVWGVPVRPDLLGAHLEAYTKAQPVLTTLRLCRRFGKGASITKVPKEIELAIEEFVLEDERKRIRAAPDGWLEQFTCFESRCSPRIHLEEIPMGHWDKAYGYSDMCDVCAEEGLESEDRENICDPESDKVCASCSTGEGDCEKSCASEQEHGVEEYLQEFVYPNYEWQENHEEVTSAWESRLAQWSKNHREALLKYFGLEASFMTTQQSNGGLGTWPKDKNHASHSFEQLPKTTMCYVHLPNRTPTKGSISPAEWDDKTIVNIQAAQCVQVDMPVTTKHGKWHTQFQRAMQALDLVTMIHRSQELTTASPITSKSSIESGSKPNIGLGGVSTSNTRLLDAKWPQLTVLIEGSLCE